MKKIKNIFQLFLLILIILLGIDSKEIILDKSKEVIDIIPNLSQNNLELKELKNIKNVKYDLNETLEEDLKLVFCPSTDCFEIFNNSISNAKFEIKCAFYELSEENLINSIYNQKNKVNISLIIDDAYLDKKNLLKLFNTNIKIYSDTKRNTRYNNYMHDKFCVIDDEILITGSANPTENGFFYNNNNILKINSIYLAKNYENQFDMMSSNLYGTNKKSQLEYNNLNLNYLNDSYKISSYFCPEDNCLKEVLNILNMAEKEIIFANFVLTHDEIEKLLLEKSSKNITVKGIIESRSVNSKGSIVNELKNNFPILIDKNPKTMHHKFYVVDNKYVITGSMNPSNSGVNYNDENILIIESEKIAENFVLEYNKLEAQFS